MDSNQLRAKAQLHCTGASTVRPNERYLVLTPAALPISFTGCSIAPSTAELQSFEKIRQLIRSLDHDDNGLARWESLLRGFQGGLLFPRGAVFFSSAGSIKRAVSPLPLFYP